METSASTVIRNRQSLFFWLLAAHSFGVGAGLIAAPEAWFIFFGFAPVGEPFFRVQAGVFHIVMVYIYITAAWRRETSVVFLAFAAKLTATIFLLVYYLTVDPIITVVLSGALDGVMAGLILLFAVPRRPDRGVA
jgi:hypothetical protein